MTLIDVMSMPGVKTQQEAMSVNVMTALQEVAIREIVVVRDCKNIYF